MLTSALLAVVPRTLEWSPTVALVMVAFNVLAIAIGRQTIQNPNVGPASPVPGLSAGALLGSLAFGHLLGTGAILGLSNLGVI